ncbi:hypothetical protein Tco_1509030 [Tanacetum coccineum]
MFLNVDQLEKQLDKEEFQEIGSMAAFKVLKTQFQMFIKSRLYMDDEYVVMTHNYFLQYTQIEILEFCDTLIQHMESVKKSIDERALHKREYDIWDKQHSKQPEFKMKERLTECEQCHDTMPMPAINQRAKNFKTVGLRWVPTGKIFTSSTTKVDSEPTNGSNDDITNHSELGIQDHSNEPYSSTLLPKVVPPVDKTSTSRQELELLFHHHITMLRSTCQNLFKNNQLKKPKELSKEELKEMLEIVPVEEIKAEALQVELKRLFELDKHDGLWKLQRYMYDPLTWRLYGTCGVHHVSSTRGHDIYMLIEKDYLLSTAVMNLMLRPFWIMDKVGTLAYRLKLSEQLSRVHSTFHVSNLKKCLIDKPLAIPLDEIQIHDKLNFIEEPVEIIDQEVKRMKQSCIPIMKDGGKTCKCVSPVNTQLVGRVGDRGRQMELVFTNGARLAVAIDAPKLFWDMVVQLCMKVTHEESI